MISRKAPEKTAKREKHTALLQQLDVNSMQDINDLFKDMIGTFLEGDLDDHLGYTKYDYRNKAPDNCRNGTSSKKLKSSYGEIDIDVPRDRKVEFEPELVKKQQTSISGDIEEKMFPTDDSLLKMLYLAMIDITKKWTGRRKDWGIIHSQLNIYFPGRMS